ncbi:hypothetical protein OG883_14930 [Streptomyces sp. NBC_01142]|uniref:hypothetical protein n=1 Tax=Streptomyces sp. NBC_01142 TaxID=2975865 RepID=UPI002255CA8C|nr:hypothetical protein [Streptomyces sp. NBC_01142]MCX4821182.1 hypothetical protein [Streptomyces sp. NBC_01142]
MRRTHRLEEVVVLFKRTVLDGIAEGRINLAFRTWRNPRVRAGSQIRTAIGVLEVVSLDQIEMDRISAQEARRAGYTSLDDLLAELREREGSTYRIGLRRAGDDPRESLRRDDTLDEAAIDELRGRLARLDAASRHGPWTLQVLALIAAHPGTRAADLAVRTGRERLAFKSDVRKLKELGLTESLEIGYRLSPRGRAALARLRNRD